LAGATPTRTGKQQRRDKQRSQHVGHPMHLVLLRKDTHSLPHTVLVILEAKRDRHDITRYHGFEKRKEDRGTTSWAAGTDWCFQFSSPGFMISLGSLDPKGNR
jgi:hypothetical protein